MGWYQVYLIAIGIPEGGQRENEAENIVVKGMPKNSPNLWNTQTYRVKKPGKLQVG